MWPFNSRRMDEKPYVYTKREHAWGNHISIDDWGKRRVWGHLPRKPQDGDVLRMPMQSHRVGLFRFRDVEYPGDPPDMFFARLEDWRYEDEGEPMPETRPPAKLMLGAPA